MLLMITLAAAVAGGALLERLHVPAGALIGAMLAVAGLKLAWGQAQAMPASGRFLAYVVVGWVAGESISRDTLTAVRPLLLPLGVSLATLLVVAAACAYALTLLGVLDPATAYLAMSPGALSQMVVLGTETGANVPVLIGVHLARVVAVVLVVPAILRLISIG